MRQVSKQVRRIRIACLGLLVFGTAVAGFVHTAAAEDLRKTVETNNAKWAEAFNRGDAAGVAALYTEDATLMPPGASMVEGRQAIQDFWQKVIQSGLKDAALTTVNVQGNGDTAYEIGKVSLTAHLPGKDPQVISGKYVVVWKKGSDDMWKLHVDIWNSSMNPR